MYNGDLIHMIPFKVATIWSGSLVSPITLNNK